MLRTLAGILIVILTASSCGNETPTICSTEGLGVLQGYVTSAGQGVAIQVEARNMEEPFTGAVLHVTESDSTGWYRMELPTGLYRLEAGSRFSESRYTMVGDIIRVLPRVFRMDLKRGRAEVRVLLPEDFTNPHYSLQLRRDDELAAGSASAWPEDGVLTFEIPVAPPGTYTMHIPFPGTNERFYLPGTLEPFAADQLIIGTDELAAYEVDFRDEFASISGSITGSWQVSPGSYMSVEMVAADSTEVGDIGCSSDGTFVFETPIAGEFRLRSACGGVRQWIGGSSFESARVFHLEAGARFTGVNLVESGLSVSLDGPGNQIVHAAQVMVRGQDGAEFHSDTSWNNPFTIHNLRPGLNYLFVNGHCTDQTWAPQWYQGSGDMGGATPIDLPEGGMTSITMELVTGGGIEGSVLKSDGTSPNRSYVGVFDLEGEPLCPGWGEWRSFDDGHFTFSGLGDGSYYLATLYLDEPLWYPGTWDFSEAELITIENHASWTGLEIQRPTLPLGATP